MIMKHIKRLNLLALLLIIGMAVQAQKFHDLPLVSHDRNAVALKTLHGKKIMVIILGRDSMETALIRQLIAFEIRYKDVVQVIAILSYEDGYQGKVRALFTKKIRQALSSVIFTKGYFTRKGNNQSAVMRWLTNKEKNTHFEQEVKGVGQKFFIDETGELYAVLGPEVSLDSKLIARVVRRN